MCKTARRTWLRRANGGLRRIDYQSSIKKLNEINDFPRIPKPLQGHCLMSGLGLSSAVPPSQVWPVGALCRAVADALEARFNPVAVSGEISGFSRAASGHCYFSLKDENGQLRCAMFRRAASMLQFTPREGDRVEVRGRLGVYEPRGDLQLVVESMTRAGAGTLFEQFMQLKTRLEAEGLFDIARKRPLPAMPRGIGLVTSTGAAALHDVVTALQRRAPHIPVVLAPASVQGAAAAGELATALGRLYAMALQESPAIAIDSIILVRGGGSLEDLWSFNDEALARVIARSPVPLVCGVGHETDFTIADFVADVRAPTPTAAAELASAPQQVCLQELSLKAATLRRSVQRTMERQAQLLDHTSERVRRPSAVVAQQAARLEALAQRMRHGVRASVLGKRQSRDECAAALPKAAGRALELQGRYVSSAGLRLGALNPALVLRRGYAWMADGQGRPLTRVAQLTPGDQVSAILADGAVDLSVKTVRPN